MKHALFSSPPSRCTLSIAQQLLFEFFHTANVKRILPPSNTGIYRYHEIWVWRGPKFEILSLGAHQNLPQFAP